MIKKLRIKRSMAVLFYGIGILFSLFIGIIILRGNVIFDVTGLLISAIGVCVPIAIGTYLLISGTSNVEKRYRIMTLFLFILLIFYVMLLVSILFHNGMRQGMQEFGAMDTINMRQYLQWNANFIPFKTVGTYVQSFINGSMNKSIIIENILGNLLLFAPMGILLPSIFQGLRKFKKFILSILILLIAVEGVQLFTFSRSFDVDDILLNLSGALLFYGIWNLHITQRLLKKIYAIK